MRTKEKTHKHVQIREVPIYKIRMMDDDEWNRLAYQNYLSRKVVFDHEPVSC